MADHKPREVILAEKRRALRDTLRQQYVKQVTNPHAEGLLFDPGVQRYTSMKVTMTERFKPTVRNFAGWVTSCILPIVLFATFIHKRRVKREQAYRNGEVKYKDRLFKLQG